MKIAVCSWASRSVGDETVAIAKTADGGTSSGDSGKIRKLAAGFTDGLEHFKDLFGGSVGVYDA